nr:DUF6768 family protein [Allomuricauda sp.]
MKKELEKIDELIKEALNEEEASFYDELGEENFMEKLGTVYRGKLGWLTALMNVVHLLTFVCFIYCIVQFFNTSDTNELILWSSAGFLCMIVMGMLKLFVWMQMNKNDVLREIKRLELQVSLLANKKNGSK